VSEGNGRDAQFHSRDLPSVGDHIPGVVETLVQSDSSQVEKPDAV